MLTSDIDHDEKPFSGMLNKVYVCICWETIILSITAFGKRPPRQCTTSVNGYDRVPHITYPKENTILSRRVYTKTKI